MQRNSTSGTGQKELAIAYTDKPVSSCAESQSGSHLDLGHLVGQP